MAARISLKIPTKSTHGKFHGNGCAAVISPEIGIAREYFRCSELALGPVANDMSAK